MRNLTPFRLSVFISLAASAICILFLYLSRKIDHVLSGQLLYALLFIVCFCLFYLIVYIAIEKFIYSKIKLIYRTINTLKSTGDEAFKKIDLRKDVVNQVNQEVLSWVTNKKEEIEQLKKLEIFRREFLGNVSHELKTPLFSIQGYIHTLIDSELEDEHINMLYLEKAARSVERLCTIVDDLEAISKLESGALILEVREFDIHELTKDVYDSLEMKARERNMQLSFKPGCDKPFFVEADKDRIRQVLTNLVANSIKYGKLGGKTETGFFDMHDNILIEVSDNGIGVEESYLPRLFERFFRVDKSRSREQGGTGLGLSIVKHIIEAHNQSISVKSVIGQGTTFWFMLKKA